MHMSLKTWSLVIIRQSSKIGPRIYSCSNGLLTNIESIILNLNWQTYIVIFRYSYHFDTVPNWARALYIAYYTWPSKFHIIHALHTYNVHVHWGGPTPFFSKTHRNLDLGMGKNGQKWGKKVYGKRGKKYSF